MRHILLFPCLFTASFLLAQSKTPEYSQNQYAAPVQKTTTADCYLRKYDAGTSAMRRGDYIAALRLFEAAKTCPEALSSSRKIKELDTRIEYCNQKLGRNMVADAQKSSTTRRAENIETTGRKFNISATLSRNTDPNCFQMTVREADRAFRDSCWDDAAKLYRAAKTCTDANQTDRESMSKRIEACRAATEDELLQKEQKAIRTARHAIAANRADDAMDLLRQGDRSLAWRLADFANFYIAPDDNPDCLEAMYGAYFYATPVDEKVAINPPFCYQLSEDLGQNVQLKFSKNKLGERLTAFIQDGSKIICWELPSMKIVEAFPPAPITTTGFDVMPDGSLLYYDFNAFYLPNGQTVAVQGAESAKHCFSEDGEVFYYEDVSAGMIRSVNMNQPARIQQQRKGVSNSNIRRISPLPAAIPSTSALLDMKAYKGELWLGYDNRVEVLARDKATGAMQPRTTWWLADTSLANGGVFSMYLSPASREVMALVAEEGYHYLLPVAPGDTSQVTVSANNKLKAPIVACTAGTDSLLSVSLETTPNNYEEILTLHAPAAKKIASRFYTRTGPYPTVFTAISENGHWIACHDARGVTKLWSMRDTCVNPPIFFACGYENQFSPDGNHLYSKTATGLNVFDADDLADGAQQEIKTLEDINFLPKGAANKWAVYFSKENEISIQQHATRQAYHYAIDKIEGQVTPYAFDQAETRYFAYSPGNGLVVVKSLSDQSILGSRNFGGEVTMIRSIPGADKFLVITKSKDANESESRYTVKVWDLSKPTENPKVVRLQGYNVHHACVSEQGDRLALSNYTDIRIFLLDNLDNESVVIKPPKSAFINDIAFRPDGLAIVSGESDGNLVIWDVTTGQPMLHFSNTWEGQKYSVERLAYAYGGTRLRLYSPGRLFTVNLDAYTLRDVVASDQRWLTSFSSEQIREYALEIAFKYPGNFDRLAESGDFPLIRSFFQYFRDQSISSNNIDQVRTYCERAYTLYELLDASGQENLGYTMIEMYEYYILKLLLRNNPEEASRVVMHLEKHFNQPNVAILSAAHCSLVQHDLKAASRRYTDYLLSVPYDGAFPYKLSEINTKLSQFQDYDLLDSTQITCLCEVFQQFNSFEKLCPPQKTYTTPAYSAQVTIYQNIYRALDTVLYTNNANLKVSVLEEALSKALTLDYPNTGVETHPLEVVIIALAEAYKSQADFEQNSPKTPMRYKKAIDLLEKYGSARTAEFSVARLNQLAEIQYLWGRYLLDNDKLSEAILHFNAALQSGKKLSTLMGAETISGVNADILDLSPLYLELCKARLLEGKAAEARKAYEQANEYLTPKLNTILLGHAALLENNEAEALINYGSISTSSELGEALFLIQRMADLLPMFRLRLLAFAPRLRTEFLSRHPDISLTEVNYWQATWQVDHFQVKSQWDSTFTWSTVALNKATALMAQSTYTDQWQSSWIEQNQHNIYYQLMSQYADTSALSAIITRSQEMLAFLSENNLYYFNFFNTNLAHALWLRNRSGDRTLALQTYQGLLANQDARESWEILKKDFIDLHRAGLQWPDLRNLIRQIKPDGVELKPEDWAEMGE